MYAGQVLAFAAQSVDDPRTHAGKSHARRTRVHQVQRHAVHERFVMAGADDRHVVDESRDVREQVGDFDSGLPVLRELPLRRQQRRVGRIGELEPHIAQALRQPLAVQFLEQRLGIEGVEVARARRA